MRSVATRLFIVFVALVVGLLLVSTLVSTLFLKPYYVSTNRRLLTDAARQVDDALRRGDIDSFIRNIDRAQGISVIIADPEYRVVRSSFAMNQDAGSARLPGELSDLVRKLQTPGQPQPGPTPPAGQVIYQTVADQEFSVQQLALVTRLSNGDYLVLRKPMRGIDESASIANRFLLFSGTGIAVLGSVIIFLFSRRLTRPVAEMSRVADDIANLDFSRRVEVLSEDEIGTLARSINQMAERLDAAVGELKEDVERRKRLVRDMSHELKTPIGIIKGYAEALKFGLTQDTDKYLTVIAAEVDRMDQMVKDMLKLSQLEGGGTELKRIPFGAKELLNKLVERYGPVADAKHVALESEDPGGLHLDGDPELIERAVGNFVTNAIRYTPQGGRVESSAKRNGDQVVVSVFNSGSRISDEDLPHLWDAFYRAEKGRTRDSRGHGLGLSIARRIAELHGGTCSVENVEEGVTFSINLPDTSRGLHTSLL